MVLTEPVLIRNVTRRNGLTVTLASALALGVSMLYLAWTSESPPLVGYFLLVCSLAGILIGIAKQYEPEVVLAVCAQGLVYRHRYGQWQIPWANIQRMGQPRVRRGIEHHDLAYLGIRLHEPAQMLAHLSPRLANRLLMQQRPLLLVDSDCPSGQCYADSLLEDDRIKLSDGRVLHGIQAMFLHRMQRLRTSLGYDLYIELNEIDMAPGRLLSLLRDSRQQWVMQDVADSEK